MLKLQEIKSRELKKPIFVSLRMSYSEYIEEALYFHLQNLPRGTVQAKR